MGIDAAIAALTESTELRTWSLIATIFGDLARAPGAEIPGPVLSAITARIGVKPEATRVALHRLRKDNWITSRRVGRVSHYLLTAGGRAETETATRRIYAAHPAVQKTWHVLVAGPMDPADRLARDGLFAAKGYVALAPGTWLGAGPAPDMDPELFVIEGRPGALPAWLQAAIMPAPLAHAYDTFAISIDAATEAVNRTTGSALDRAALRVLVVHGWRRLVLRHPDLPDSFFPSTWRGPETRARVQQILTHLGQPSVAEISAVLADA